MKTDWLHEDLWRSHVSWLTPSWVGETPEARKDFDAKTWLDQLESAHYRTWIFYIKHHDGFTAYPSKFSKAQPDRDFFGECVAETRRRGMRIIAYYSSVLDQITGNAHPDWRVMNREGKPADGWYNTYWPGCCCCINNPGYRNLLLGQLTELRDNYGPDGFWLDVFSPHNGENCFCPHCRELYREETQGGDLLETKGEAWYDTCFVKLMAEIRKLVKKVNPDCVLGQNTGIRIPGVEEHVDFLTHEALDSIMISLMCRGMRSVGKPVESTYRLYSAVGSWSMKGWNRILLEAGASLAHGAACCLELPPIHTGKIMDEPVARLTELGEYVRAIEPYLVGTTGVYDAALFDLETQFGWSNRQEPGWHTVLMERDVPFTIVYPDADIAAYPLVIVDDKIITDEGLARKLKTYVENGGNLIVEERAEWRGGPAEEILSEILGIVSLGKTGRPAQYVSDLDSRLKTGMGEDELIVEGEACRVATTAAEPLAFLRYEFSARAPDKNIMINLPAAKARSNDPAITINRYGKGRAMYVAFPLVSTELRGHKNRWADAREFSAQLAENLVRFMLPRPLLLGNTPAGVEIVVNARDNLHIVHLLNHYATGQYIDNRRGLLKLADMPVTLDERRIGPVKRAIRVVGREKTELALRRTGSWVEVRIPELGIHEIVVLES